MTEKAQTFDPHSAFVGKIDGGAAKFSQIAGYSKLPLWLVPGSLTRAAGRALMFGAVKYDSNQWRRGLKFSEVLSALERHVQDMKDGQMYAPDSALLHTDHIGANLAFLTHFLDNAEYQPFNDLYVVPQKLPETADQIISRMARERAAKIEAAGR